MTNMTRRSGGTFAAAMMGVAGFVGHADAQPLVVTNGDTLVLTEANDSPFATDGARIGPSITDLPGDPVVGSPTSGTVIVGENVQWTNTGQFYVGSHFGIQDGAGMVEFLSGSVFNSFSTGLGETPPADVRIGQGAAGTVALHEGAVWNHTGQPNQTNFTVGEQGVLVINGQLFSDTSAGISGEVILEGPLAQWQIGNQNDSLDVAGFGGATANLSIAQGGQAFFDGSGFIGIGFGGGTSGQVSVGHADDFEKSILSVGVGLIEVGTFNNQFTGPGQGTLNVNANGRVETDRLMLGRGGGVGNVFVNQGGELLVGGFSGFFNSVEIYQGSTLDLSAGGKVVVGTNNDSALGPGFGNPNEFDNINDATLLVGANGILKGTGTIIGDVVVTDGGTINPGHSPGTLNIVGDLTLLSDGVLTIEIADATDFDQINVSGLLTLGGTLNIAFVDGFTPGEGQQFTLDIFGDADVAGSFSAVTSEGLADGLFADADLIALADGQPLDFTVAAVPEPSSIAVFLLFATAARRRRRSA